MPLVKVKNFSFKYEGAQEWALKDVSLELSENELLLIVGPTGSGKSTLCYALCGLIPHKLSGEAQGEIYVLGKRTDQWEFHRLIQNITMLFQNPENQLCCLTVKDEIEFSLINFGLNEVEERVSYAASLVCIKHLLDRYVFNLSYGEKQRVALASLLALKPKVIVLDEPFAHQDFFARERLVDTLKKLKDEKGLIVAEHRLWEVARLADKVLALNDGRVVFYGDVEDFEEEHVPEKLGLRTQMESYRRRSHSTGDVILKVMDLWFKYDERYVLKGVSFMGRKGELIFLVGRNGAGKSTLGMCIAGLLKPCRGEILIDSKRVERPTKEIIYLPQNPDLAFVEETVFDEVALGLRAIGLREEEVRERVYDALDTLGLLRLKDRNPRELSRGQRTLLLITMAYALKPKVIIADEPTTGQDFRSMRSIIEALNRLCEEGCLVIGITHDVDVAEHVADKVLRLEDGKVEEV